MALYTHTRYTCSTLFVLWTISACDSGSSSSDDSGVFGDSGSADSGSPDDSGVDDDRTETAEMLDCSDFTNQEDPRCAPNLSPGGLGSGPPMDGDLGAGFVDAANNRLIVAVDNLGQQGEQGAIYSIDLRTGDREILTGYTVDPQLGDSYIGDGPQYGAFMSVQPTSSGSAYAFVAAPGDVEPPRAIIEIDLESGARTERFRFGSVSPAEDACRFVLGYDASPITAMVVDPNDDNLIYLIYDTDLPSFIEQDGQRIELISGNGDGNQGIMRIDLENQGCRVFSAPVQNGDRGGGWGWQDFPRGLNLNAQKDAIIGSAFLGQSLFEIDLETGDRARLSSSEGNNRYGEGVQIGYGHVTEAFGSIWISDQRGGSVFAVMRVDRTSGDREGFSIGDGPLPANDTPIWAHPDGQRFILARSGGLLLWDWQQNLRNNLSR